MLVTSRAWIINFLGMLTQGLMRFLKTGEILNRVTMNMMNFDSSATNASVKCQRFRKTQITPNIEFQDFERTYKVSDSYVKRYPRQYLKMCCDGYPYSLYVMIIITIIIIVIFIVIVIVIVIVIAIVIIITSVARFCSTTETGLIPIRVRWRRMVRESLASSKNCDSKLGPN